MSLMDPETRATGRSGERLEPVAGPLAEFAADLEALRRNAGNPTYDQLESWTGYPASELSAATSGRMMPSLAMTEAYARACRADEAEWVRRWNDLQERLGSATEQPAHGGREWLNITPAEEWLAMASSLPSGEPFPPGEPFRPEEPASPADVPDSADEPVLAPASETVTATDPAWSMDPMDPMDPAEPTVAASHGTALAPPQHGETPPFPNDWVRPPREHSRPPREHSRQAAKEWPGTGDEFPRYQVPARGAAASAGRRPRNPRGPHGPAGPATYGRRPRRLLSVTSVLAVFAVAAGVIVFYSYFHAPPRHGAVARPSHSAALSPHAAHSAAGTRAAVTRAAGTRAAGTQAAGTQVPGAAAFPAIAGVGCAAPAGTAAATGTRGAGGDGWQAVQGGLQACGGKALATRKTGTTGAVQDIYTWTFRTGNVATCSAQIFIADTAPSSGIAHYDVFGRSLVPGTSIAQFDINQRAEKGQWVQAGTWQIQGVLTIELTDAPSFPGDMFHVTASAVKVSCP